MDLFWDVTFLSRILHLFDNMKYSGDHWHVNPQCVCAGVKLVLQLSFS